MIKWRLCDIGKFVQMLAAVPINWTGPEYYLVTDVAALEARCIEAEQAEANSHRCHEATIVRCDAAEARCRDAAKLISDVVETPDQFETEWNKAAREWLASTSETGAKP